MPAAKSNQSRYVIPEDLDPEGICCVHIPVPDDPQWRAMLLGALWRLSLQTNWERDAAHSAKVVAARWREVWREVSEMTCCGTAGAITNVTLNSQMVQNMQMALAWQQIWIDNSSTVSLAYYEIPDTYSTDAGDVGDEVTQREQALCLAIQGWTNEVMNYMESWMISNVEEAAIIAGSSLVGLASITGLLMWPLAIGWAVGVEIGIAAFLELRRTEYRQYIQCRMYENLAGKDPDSRADFEASLTADPIGRPQPETVFQDVARDAIETYLRGQLNNLDNYLMFAGQLGTAMDIARSGAVDCPCLDEWEQIWLDGYGLGDWDIVPRTDPPFDPGVYDPINDRVDGDCVSADGVAVSMKITFPSTVITQIVVSASWYGSRATSVNDTRMGTEADWLKFADCNHGYSESYGVCDTGVINSAETDLWINGFVGCFACDPAWYSRITKIIVRGQGTNPFL